MNGIIASDFFCGEILLFLFLRKKLEKRGVPKK
jgi:hypothetical protein